MAGLQCRSRCLMTGKKNARLAISAAFPASPTHLIRGQGIPAWESPDRRCEASLDQRGIRLQKAHGVSDDVAVGVVTDYDAARRPGGKVVGSQVVPNPSPANGATYIDPDGRLPAQMMDYRRDSKASK